MILQSKTQTPYIDFGFAIEEKTIQEGGEVIVWQNQIYNPDVYESVINALGGTFTKVSEYQYSITYATAGTYTITVVVSNKDKSKNYLSNSITVIVE